VRSDASSIELYLKEFEKAYQATGKRYDVGKSCVRFRKLDDLLLSLIGEAIARMSMEEFIRRMKEVHPPRKRIRQR